MSGDHPAYGGGAVGEGGELRPEEPTGVQRDHRSLPSGAADGDRRDDRPGNRTSPLPGNRTSSLSDNRIGPLPGNGTSPLPGNGISPLPGNRIGSLSGNRIDPRRGNRIGSRAVRGDRDTAGRAHRLALLIGRRRPVRQSWKGSAHGVGPHGPHGPRRSVGSDGIQAPGVIDVPVSG
ncbi:hypothetical protein Shyhy02_77310 [Streptomyces hygroscopicus subsp. hygroscopicus]|nr:hypothetical protein Shyhy02_77310 [Streptomyces hygroscopicus subsp. hygroscopicus]